MAGGMLNNEYNPAVQCFHPQSVDLNQLYMFSSISITSIPQADAIAII